MRALVAAGYRILAKNLRTPAGEVDVLALDGETLAIVEVKATAGTRGPSPAARVDHGKRDRLRGVRRLLGRGGPLASRPYRFDVVAVTFEDGRPRCEVRRGAFRSRG